LTAGNSIKAFWSTEFSDFDATSLTIFVCVYFCIFAWTNGCSMPTGSFTPTILLGSAMGRLYAHCLYRLGLVQEPDAPMYALLGAAGFFTGALSVISIGAISQMHAQASGSSLSISQLLTFFLSLLLSLRLALLPLQHRAWRFLSGLGLEAISLKMTAAQCAHQRCTLHVGVALHIH
jgi:hypothetical protein